MYSAYNSHCYNPPIVIYQGQPVLVVTKNPYTQTNGLSVIDPDLLLGIYIELATSVPTNLVQVQLQSLTHARQTAAEAINQAMMATAQMFH